MVGEASVVGNGAGSGYFCVIETANLTMLAMTGRCIMPLLLTCATMVLAADH